MLVTTPIKLTAKSAQEYLNGILSPPQQMQDLLKKCKDVFMEVSLHTKGARPKFKDPSSDKGLEIVPPRYLGEDYQTLFDNYLLSRHPREPEVTRNWRYSQYRPFTKAPFGMLTDIIRGAIFQDSQYTLTLPDKEDHDYIWGNNFFGKNLIQLFSEVILPAINEDPNGLTVRIPSKPWYEQTASRVEVEAFFVNSKDIAYFSPSDLVFKREQFAYWITSVAIFRYTKDAGGQYNLEPRGYYSTRLGYIPASVGGGIWNTDGYYDSFFDKAIAAANEFISSFSAEQMVDKEASHPYITQVEPEACRECHGAGEVKMTDHHTGKPHMAKCPTCNGKGTMSNNPADRLMVNMDDWEKLKDGGTKLTNPDTTINKYHREKNTQIMEMILRALNLLNIDAAQSGTAKAIDLEKLHLFISAVSNNIFDNHIFPTIRDIVAYRNVRATGPETAPAPYVYDFTLIKPTQFQVKTAADLMEELTESTKGNIPGYIRKKQVVEFVDKRFAGDDAFQKKTEVIADLDDLYVYTPDERMTMRTTGEVTPEDLIFSRKLPSILDSLIRDKGTKWFIRAKIDDIKALVDESMKPFLVKKVLALLDDNGNTEDDET